MNALGLTAEDFKSLNPQALSEGLLDGCDAFRVKGLHEKPKNPYKTGTKESQSYYIGYVKSLSTLDQIIHGNTNSKRKEDSERCDKPPEQRRENNENFS